MQMTSGAVVESFDVIARSRSFDRLRPIQIIHFLVRLGVVLAVVRARERVVQRQRVGERVVLAHLNRPRARRRRRRRRVVPVRVVHVPRRVVVQFRSTPRAPRRRASSSSSPVVFSASPVVAGASTRVASRVASASSRAPFAAAPFAVSANIARVDANSRSARLEAARRVGVARARIGDSPMFVAATRSMARDARARGGRRANDTTKRASRSYLDSNQSRWITACAIRGRGARRSTARSRMDTLRVNSKSRVITNYTIRP